MAKRYSSSWVNEKSTMQCNLPDEVIVRDITKNDGFSQSPVKDLYQCVEAQFMKDKSELKRVEKVEKF